MPERRQANAPGGYSEGIQSVWQDTHSLPSATDVRGDLEARFIAAITPLNGAGIVAVRDWLRAVRADGYAAGLIDGKRECLSSIWRLDPDSAEVAQLIAELADPLPEVRRHRLDRAPAERLSPNRNNWSGVTDRGVAA